MSDLDYSKLVHGKNTTFKQTTHLWEEEDKMV